MQKKLTAIAMVSVCIRDVSYKTKDFFWLPPLTLLLAEGSVLPCNVPELGVFWGQNLWCFSSRASTLLTRSKGMGTQVSRVTHSFTNTLRVDRGEEERGSVMPP